MLHDFNSLEGLVRGSLTVGVACAGLVFVFAGCDGGPKVYPVTGLVTYEGKPVEGASVTFVSNASVATFATTDASGKFSMATRGAPGLPAGEYQVGISKVESGNVPKMAAEDMMKMQKAGPSAIPKPLLPPKYSSVQSSGLTATVTTDKSKNNFTFDLQP